MNDLTIGILSSIIATFLIYILVKPFRNVMNSFIFMLIKNKRIGLKSISLNRNLAIKRIYPDLLRSKEIMVLNFKGYSLIDNNFYQTKLYQLTENGRVTKARFLLLNPESEKYIEQRKSRLIGLIKGSNSDDYKDDIRSNIKLLKRFNDNKEIKIDCYCRLFNEELKWGLVISDNYILVNFYPFNRTAPKSPCMIIKRNNTLLGDSFERYFNDLWENHSSNAYVEKSKLRTILIAGGSFQGKSLIALSLANKYNFSGVVTTDLIRNILKIQDPNNENLSTSTYKLSHEQLEIQKKKVSSIVEKQIEIYKNRGERIIFEGMHFSYDFIKKLKDENSLKIFLNNNRPLRDRVTLKQKTRFQFSIENELEYSSLDSVDFTKTSYFTNQDRIKEIHENLRSSCISNGFIEVNFNNIDEAIKKCDHLVEKYLLS